MVAWGKFSVIPFHTRMHRCYRRSFALSDSPLSRKLAWKLILFRENQLGKSVRCRENQLGKSVRCRESQLGNPSVVEKISLENPSVVEKISFHPLSKKEEINRASQNLGGCDNTHIENGGFRKAVDDVFPQTHASLGVCLRSHSPR